MPKGYDSSQQPARKVSKDALKQPQPYSGGAGGKEPPKKEVAIGGAPPPPPPPGGPNDPNKGYRLPQKKRDDYNNPPSKPAPSKDKPARKVSKEDGKKEQPYGGDKGYPNQFGPKKKQDDYNKPRPKTNEDDNKKDKGYPSKIGPKKEDNPHKEPYAPHKKPNPDYKKPAKWDDPKKDSKKYPKESREDKYKNGWYK